MEYSRFNYVIKTALDKWDEDKAGIKFTEYVIKPVLDYVSDLLYTYRTQYLAKELCNKEYTKEELMDIMKLTGYTFDLHTELNNESFIKPILRELSPRKFVSDKFSRLELSLDNSQPYLRFLESELEEIEQEELDEIEEKERFEELEKIKNHLENLIIQNKENEQDNYSDIEEINPKKINICTLKKKKNIKIYNISHT
jgi:hypothetical protein